jgi:hypothetical protein
LLQYKNEAALEFSKALADLLHAEQMTSRNGKYCGLRQTAECARKHSDSANQTWEDHLRAHGCDSIGMDDTASNDADTPDYPLLVAETV